MRINMPPIKSLDQRAGCALFNLNIGIEVVANRRARSTLTLGGSWYRTGSGSDRVKHSTFVTTRKSRTNAQKISTRELIRFTQ